MAKTYDACKILQVMIVLEQKSIHFYETAAKKAMIDREKLVYRKLADEERIHEKVYRHLAANMPELRSCSIEEDEEQYLELLIDTNFFIRAVEDDEKMERLIQSSDVLDLAERLERDSIHFLVELIRIAPALKKHESIQKALSEERRHLRMILEKQRLKYIV